MLSVDLDHGCIDASAEALDLRQGEHLVLGGLTHPDPQGLLAGSEDLVGTSKPARSGCANLQVKFELCQHCVHAPYDKICDAYRDTSSAGPVTCGLVL